jgi:hypothetical protein
MPQEVPPECTTVQEIQMQQQDKDQQKNKFLGDSKTEKRPKAKRSLQVVIPDALPAACYKNLFFGSTNRTTGIKEAACQKTIFYSVDASLKP